MNDRLDLFEAGEVSLRHLIAALESLLSALQGEQIRTDLREPWGILEEVYSVAMSLHEGKLDNHGELLVADAAKDIRGRIAAWISKSS
jgi:hypothetical protein